MTEYLDLLRKDSRVSENVKIEYLEYPYKHIVIDNLFTDQIYEKISKKFPDFIKKVPMRHGSVGETELKYNAHIYSITENDKAQDENGGVDFLNSLFFQQFIGKIFNLRFTNHIASSAHWHKGSKESKSADGWPHADWSICSANPSNEKISIIENIQYSDDTNRNLKSIKIARSVAYLYYLNNPNNLSEKNGGGTGVYLANDKNTLIKQVLPFNNRLFAFECTPNSWHSFIGADFDRSAMVNWFHTSPAYNVHRNLAKVKERINNGQSLFERWIPKEQAWNIENDIYYKNFFDKPITEVFGKSLDQILK